MQQASEIDFATNIGTGSKMTMRQDVEDAEDAG